MGDNQNRGSGDAFRRNQAGRKRREPPMIDGTATEVSATPPVEDFESVEADRLGGTETPLDSGSGALPAKDETEAKLLSEEVVMVPAAAETPAELAGPNHPQDDKTVAADDRLTPLGGAALETPAVGESALDPAPVRSGDEVGPFSAPPFGVRELADDAPPTAPQEPDGFSAAAPRAEPARARSILPLGLGVVIAILLAGLVALLYGGSPFGGSADLAAQVDALTRRVAVLEARPEAAKPDTDANNSLDMRAKPLESDVGGLKTALSALATKLDSVSEQAAANAEKIATLEQHAAAEAPTPPAATETPAPSGMPAPEEPAPQPPAQTAETPAAPDAPAPLAAEPAPPAAAPAPTAAAPVPPAPADSAELAALSGRLDNLAQRVAALPVAPPPVDLAPLQARFADLSQRIDAEQIALAAVPKVDPQAIDGRLGGLDRKLDDTGHRLDSLSATVAALPKIDLAPLSAAIADVDKRLAPIETALSVPKDGDRVTDARAEGSAELDRAAPLAVVAESVSNALDDGRPFASEIDALHGLGLVDADLGPLPGLAAKGAPTADQLRQQWTGVQTAVLTASGPKTGDSVLDRFAAGARNLVQIRQVGAVAGDDPSAASARISAALDRADVAEALAEWAKLPEAGRAASQAWADAARSRIEAESTAQSLLGRAIAALAKAKE